jgi:hypothetical protein
MQGRGSQLGEKRQRVTEKGLCSAAGPMSGTWHHPKRGGWVGNKEGGGDAQ